MRRSLARIEDIEMLKRKITAYLLHPGSETVQDSRREQNDSSLATLSVFAG